MRSELASHTPSRIGKHTIPYSTMPLPCEVRLSDQSVTLMAAMQCELLVSNARPEGAFPNAKMGPPV